MLHYRLRIRYPHFPQVSISCKISVHGARRALSLSLGNVSGRGLLHDEVFQYRKTYGFSEFDSP